MSLVLHRIDDPRDALSRARRKPLELFARDAAIIEIKAGMPGDLMKCIIRMKGYVERYKEWAARNRIVNPPLGGEKPQPTNGADENAINADDDLMRQWMAQHQTVSEDQPTNSPADRKPVEKMGINELRAECKSRGIKLSRRDNMKSLKDKLLGQDTA